MTYQNKRISNSTTSITDMFSDPEDRNTSNSRHSSNFFTIESQPENNTMLIDLETDEILLPNLVTCPVSQAEKTDNINTWMDTTPPPILSPSNDPVPHDETMAISEVSGFTDLSHCSIDTRSWLKDTKSILPHLQGNWRHWNIMMDG